MIKVQQSRNIPAFITSVTLHIVVLLILIISFEFHAPMPVVENVDNGLKAISAVAVNAPAAPVEIAPPPKAIKKPKPVKAQEPPKPAAPKAPVDKKPEVEIKKPDAIPIKKTQDKKIEQHADLEKKFLEDIKKVKTKKNDLDKKLKEQAEKALQEQLLQAQKRAAGAKALGEVNKYKALILQAISRYWLVPPGTNKKLYSELVIRLAPSGLVLDVQISRSSGDVALDRSARNAVFKASPLPVPTDATAFNQFRQFVLKVKPENIVAQDVS